MNRRPAVAGSFYPATQKELASELGKLFESAMPPAGGNVAALIVPHAGYVFSGGVAASAFNQLDGSCNYSKVFVIGSAHRNSFHGASVFSASDFDMPYGTEVVEKAVGESLCRDYPALFSSNPLHHAGEHGIEVQLPFLNYVLEPGYSVVPVLLGEVTPQECSQIASVLAPWFGDGNLFVISTDFSHYPDYDDACRVDRQTMEAIVGGSPDRLVEVLDSNASQKVRDLYTSLCGWSAVLVLMNLANNPGGKHCYSYKALEYKNSGDNELYGERDRVVGYWAISVLREESSGLLFSDKEKEILRKIARESVLAAACGGKPSGLSQMTSGTELTPNLQLECGVFVTLKKHGELRGCIGYTESNTPLYLLVAEVAELSACHDYRFERVKPGEAEELEIEISVLSPMRKIKDISEIKLGRHGVLIKKGERTGLFLPQVAIETGWTLEQYLGHCSRDKAGIGWEGWREASLSTFTVDLI